MKRTLQLIFALLILSLLVYKVGAYDLWLLFSQLSLEAIAYLAIISIVLVYISALKWKLFLEVLSEQVSVFRLFWLYLVGYFVNLIVPSYVGGDAVRSWYIGKKVGQHHALAATILERYTGMLAMITMAFCFMWFVSSVTVNIKVIVFCMAFGLATSTFLVLSLKFHKLFERLKFPAKILTHIEKVRAGLNFARQHYGLLAKALGLSFLYHSCAVLNTMAAAYAVGWNQVPLWDLFVVLPIILLIGALPLTPNGLGLQEGAFYYFLEGLGATSGQAFAIALILRAKSYVLALLGGIVWLVERKNGLAPLDVKS